MQPEKALTANAMTEEYGKRGLRSQIPNNSEMAIGCDLGAEPGLRKSESRGEISKEKSPFCFCERAVTESALAVSPIRLPQEERMLTWPNRGKICV
jgi:hypothetical protein